MESIYKRFLDKTIVITNAGGSVAISTARLFHQEGANVVVNDARKERIDELTKEFDSRVLITTFDLRKSGAGIKLSNAALDKFGSIDVLVCNEGKSAGKSIDKISVEHWDEMIDRNLTEIFHALQGVHAHFRDKQYGTIVLVSSIAARSGCGDMADYASSMGGVLGIMKTVSREWSKWGVTCSAVCPGPIAEGDQGLPSNMRNQFSQSKVELANKDVTAEQVAKIIQFLASEDGRPINGQAINVDYGLYLYSL